jgi:hypothetical protein
MNVERLRHVLGRLRAQIASSEIEARAQNLENALQQQVSQPGQGSLQTQVFDALERLRSSLRSAQEDPTGAFWLEAVEEIGLKRFLPPEIFARINAIVYENQITPAVALQRVRELRTEIANTRERIDQLISNLEWLGVREPDIPENKAEIGILIPRSAIDNNLENFGEEARDLNTLLNAVSQAVTGSAEDIKIASVSASEIILLVLLAPKIVRYFAGALRDVLAVGKDYLEVLAMYETRLSKDGFLQRCLIRCKRTTTNASHLELMKLLKLYLRTRLPAKPTGTILGIDWTAH